MPTSPASYVLPNVQVAGGLLNSWKTILSLHCMFVMASGVMTPLTSVVASVPVGSAPTVDVCTADNPMSEARNTMVFMANLLCRSNAPRAEHRQLHRRAGRHTDQAIAMTRTRDDSCNFLYRQSRRVNWMRQ